MLDRRHVLKGLGASSLLGLAVRRPAEARGDLEPMHPTTAASGGKRDDLPVTSIPFTLFDRRGQLAVRYGVTVDPEALGFDVIPGLGFHPEACRGYPTIHARIEHYRGAGYRTLCGWIQVITAERHRAGTAAATSPDTSIAVDQIPSMLGIDMPFAITGFLPELFDAPCGNLNGYERLRWTADTFLTTVPLRSRSEPIRRLAGVRWGYVTDTAHTDRPVSPLPLEVTDGRAWNAVLTLLRTRFPDWRFAAEG